MIYESISLENLLSSHDCQSPGADELESFSAAIQKLSNVNENESEEHQKNALSQFLAQSFGYECNTKGRIDLSIYEDEIPKALFEVKSLDNKSEFISSGSLPNLYNLESKALYESILYFLREYITHKNNSLTYIILTNTRDFYLIDSKEYLQFAKDKNILQAFRNCEKKEGINTSTQKFYDTLKDYLPTLDSTLKFTYFNLSTSPALLYQALSPALLLKRKSYIDANTLNQSFYNELLYILGLEEESKNGKVLIIPNTKPNTLLDSIARAFSLSPKEDFEDIFSLITTWNNRLLFLRLLESMLLSFKHLQKPFLQIDVLQNFESLNTLFFDILAVKENKRNAIPKELESIPYLNSSLFEKTALEQQGRMIKSLDSKPLRIYESSILYKDKTLKESLNLSKGSKDSSLPLLEYLFHFLHAYNFTTTPKDIVNHTKINHDKLINPAVLGLVFEKLNGYKEGSFYTPSFITGYMCKQSLEKIVLEKFNAAKNWECESLESLQIKLDKLTDSKDGYKEANEIFDSIKVCDPAVGSGHFLVSMLNAMIELKFRLKILCDENFNRIKDISLELENDEIVIRDSSNTLHNYQTPQKENTESHIIQKALFYNKRILIESCLFGVDINPNSCEITKLRLWIELLKYSYYIFENGKNTNALETLPNIDINIKCGNSLTSRFALQDSLQTISNIREQIEKYRKLVKNYRNASKIIETTKDDIESQIETIKQTFTLTLKDPATKSKLEKAIADHIKNYGIALLDDESILTGLSYTRNLFGNNELNEEEQEKAYISYGKIVALRKKLDFATSGEHFKDAFEWRFAFPEVLDSNGDFLGFDVVIGNPPYIRQEEIKHLKPQLQNAFSIYTGTSDIYTYFYELGYKILAQSGILSFITSNKYTRAGYGEPLREFLLENTSLLSYTELNGIKVFDSASVDTSILSFAKAKPSKSTAFIYAHPKEYNPKNNTPLKETISPQVLPQNALSKEGFIFLGPQESAIKKKIESIGTPLKDWDISIYRGILTGYNEAFIIDSTKRDEILRACASKDERKRTQNLIKPILRGRDIKRYGYEWAGLYIIGTFPALKLDIDDYPAVKKHLESYRPRIDQSGEQGCRKKTSNKWFETQDQIAYYQEFDKPKISWQRVTQEPSFVLESDYYLLDSMAFLTHYSLGELCYLLGFLNSKVIFYYFKQIGHLYADKGFLLSNQYVERFPIPKITKQNQKIADEIVELVDKILESKRADSKANTTEPESKIDSLVYKLYNLTKDEIKIIERE